MGLKPTLFFSHAKQIRNYKGSLTAQVAIFSPQFLYLLVYFICKRRFIFLARSAKDIFTSSLALKEKTSVKRLETFPLRFVFQLLQGLQENANQPDSGKHMLIRLLSTLGRSRVAHTMKRQWRHHLTP